jgi:hypothetical protein
MERTGLSVAYRSSYFNLADGGAHAGYIDCQALGDTYPDDTCAHKQKPAEQH